MLKENKTKNRKRKIIFTLVVVLFLTLVALVSNKIVYMNKYDHKIKVTKLSVLNNKKTSDDKKAVIKTEKENATIKGYDTITYKIKYMLETEDNKQIKGRTAIVEATLSDEDIKYASWNNIQIDNIESEIINSGKTLKLVIKNVTTNIENEIEVKVNIASAPDNFTIKPIIKVYERTSKVNEKEESPITQTVSTNSISGYILNKETNSFEENVELQVCKVDNTECENKKIIYSNKDGSYSFSDLKNGTYQISIVDINKYNLINDIEPIIINDNSIKMNIELASSTVFTPKLNKYIKNIIINQNGEEKEYEYNKTNRTLISLKKLENVNIKIKYEIEVTNVSKRDGYVKVIKETIPEGLSFDENIKENKNWQLIDGRLYNKTLSENILKQNETKKVEIVFTTKDKKILNKYINNVSIIGEHYYTVKYVIDDKVIKEDSVLNGDKLKEYSYEKENYEFKGWYTDKEFKNKYDFDKIIEDDLVLYGKVEKKASEQICDVTFIDKGNVIVNSKKVECGEILSPESICEDENNCKKPDYKFECFRDMDDPTVCLAPEQTVTKKMTIVTSYIKLPAPEISHTPTEWTKENVNVLMKLPSNATITRSISNKKIDSNNLVIYSEEETETTEPLILTPDKYDIEYQIVSEKEYTDETKDFNEYTLGDNWNKYNESFTQEKNAIVVGKVKVKETNETSKNLEHYITNIDKKAPIISNEYTPLIYQINLKGNIIDKQSTPSKLEIYYIEGSNIDLISYLNDETKKDLVQKQVVSFDEDISEVNYNEFLSNLKPSTTYTIGIKAYDKALNETEMEITDVTTAEDKSVAQLISVDGVSLDSPIKFPTLAQAVEYNDIYDCGTSVCVIQMIDDTIEPTVTILQNQNIELDINGKKVNGTNDNTILNLGTFKIYDNSELETGVIKNDIGTSIKNSGTLTLGSDDGTVSVTLPNVIGKTNGILESSDSIFNFYDGKIEGQIAINGEVDETPIGYDPSVNVLTHQIATLRILGEAEASIDSKMYTKLSDAILASQGGSYEIEELDNLNSLAVPSGKYHFTYDENTGTLINNTTNILENTRSGSRLELDLTDSKYNKGAMVTINSEFSISDDTHHSSFSADINYPNTNKAGSTSSTTSLFYLTKTTEAKNYSVYVSGNSIYNLNLDCNIYEQQEIGNTCKVNNISVKPVEVSKVEKNITNEADYGFEFDAETGKLKNNNQGTYKTIAAGYTELDLTDTNHYGEYVKLDVNAELDTTSRNKAYVILSDSQESPNYTSDIDRVLYLNSSTEATTYSKGLETGKKYYLHYIYITENQANLEETTDTFSINYIKVTKLFHKNLSFDDITNNGSYYFVKDSDGNLVNNNVYVNNSVSNSYFTIDLTDTEKFKNNVDLIVNADVYSERDDIGYATITKTTDAPAYTSTEGNFIKISGDNTSEKEYKISLQPGEIYYLHLGYYKDASVSRYDDKFTIKYIYLESQISETDTDATGNIDLSNVNNYSSNYEIIDDKIVINNNNNYLLRNAYSIIDLSNYSSENIYNIKLNYSITSGYFYANFSEDPILTKEKLDNPDIYAREPSDSVTANVRIKGGKVYYLLYNYEGNGSVTINDMEMSISSEENKTFPNRLPVLNDNPDTIKLLKKVTLNYTAEINNNKNVILDLNGYDLTSNYSGFVINNSGKLLITDSTINEESETITSVSNSANNVINNTKTGDLTIDKINVIALKNGTNAITNDGIAGFQNGGKVILNSVSTTAINNITNGKLRNIDISNPNKYTETTGLHNASLIPYFIENYDITDIATPIYNSDGNLKIEGSTLSGRIYNSGNLEIKNSNITDSNLNISSNIVTTGELVLDNTNFNINIINDDTTLITTTNSLKINSTRIESSSSYKGKITTNNNSNIVITNNSYVDAKIENGYSYEKVTSDVVASDSYIYFIGTNSFTNNEFSYNIDIDNCNLDSINIAPTSSKIDIKIDIKDSTVEGHITSRSADFSADNTTFNNSIENYSTMNLSNSTFKKTIRNLGSSYEISTINLDNCSLIQVRPEETDGSSSYYYPDYMIYNYGGVINFNSGSINYDSGDSSYYMFYNYGSSYIYELNQTVYSTINLGTSDGVYNEDAITINAINDQKYNMYYGDTNSIINWYDGSIKGYEASKMKFENIENLYSVDVTTEGNFEVLKQVKEPLYKILDTEGNERATQCVNSDENDNNCYSLTSAVNALNTPGEKIQLLKNIVYSEDTINISATDVILLDLNGHTFLSSKTVFDNNGSLYILDSNNSSTDYKLNNINNSKFYSGVSKGELIKNNGYLSISSIAIENLYINNNGSSTISLNTVNSYDSSFNNVSDSSGTIYATGGEYHSSRNYSESTFLNRSTTGTINLNHIEASAEYEYNYLIRSNYCSYYQNNIIIKNSKITSVYNPLSADRANITIENSTITSTKSQYPSAISIDNYDSNLTLKDSILNGRLYANCVLTTIETTTINGDADLRGTTIFKSGKVFGSVTNRGTLTLGEDDGVVNNDQIVILDNSSSYGLYNTGVLNYYDGVVYGNAEKGIDGSVKKWASGYDIIHEENSEYTYEDGTVENYGKTFLGKAPIVENLTTGFKYYDLKLAFDETIDGDTLKLLRESQVNAIEDIEIPETKSLIFDLSDYKLSNTPGIKNINNFGNLIVKSNSKVNSLSNFILNNKSEGIMKIKNISTDTVNNDGELTITNANISRIVNSSDVSNLIIENSTVVYLDNTRGTSTLNSGSIQEICNNFGNVIIEDGMVSKTPNSNDDASIKNNGSGNITINGGTIKGVINNLNGLIEIKGGSFSDSRNTSGKKTYKVAPIKNNSVDGVINISGGSVVSDYGTGITNNGTMNISSISCWSYIVNTNILEITGGEFNNRITNSGELTMNNATIKYTYSNPSEDSNAYAIHNNATANITNTTITSNDGAISNMGGFDIIANLTVNNITVNAKYHGINNSSYSVLTLGEQDNNINSGDDFIIEVSNGYGIENVASNGIVNYYDGTIIADIKKLFVSDINNIEENSDIIISPVSGSDILYSAHLGKEVAAEIYNSEGSLDENQCSSINTDSTDKHCYKLEDALSVASSNSKIVMLRPSILFNKKVMNINSSITLDTNGNSVILLKDSYFNNNSTFKVTNNKLTTSSAGIPTNDLGQIISTNKFAENNNNLTIEKLLIDKGTMTNNATGTININSGQVQEITNNVGATTNINGGAIYGEINNSGVINTTNNASFAKKIIDDSGTVNINGGTGITIQGLNNAILNVESGAISEIYGSYSDVNITNGTISSFSGRIKNLIVDNISSTGSSSLTIGNSATLNDGTFNKLRIEGNNIVINNGLYNDGSYFYNSTINNGIFKSITLNNCTVNNGKFTSIVNNGTTYFKDGIVENGSGNAINNKGTLYLGQDDDVISIVKPKITGTEYGIYNENKLYFYDGIITASNGKTIYGASIEPEHYKINTVTNYDENNIANGTESSYLIKDDEAVKVIMYNNINYDTLEDAISVAPSDGTQAVMYLQHDVTLTSDIEVPEGKNIFIYLNGNHISYNNYSFIGTGTINFEEGSSAVTGNIFNKLFKSSGNGKNIILYQMDDGSNLEITNTYKLQKLKNGVYTDVNVIDETTNVGRYSITDKNSDVLMTTINGKIYLNNLESGDYKVIDNDGKSLTFRVNNDNTLSGNIKENYTNNINRILASASATLLINIQTGQVLTRYTILMLCISTIIGLLAIIRVKNFKKLEN